MDLITLASINISNMINERLNNLITESTEIITKRRQIYEHLIAEKENGSSRSQSNESQILKEVKLMEEKTQRTAFVFEALEKKLAGTLENVKLSRYNEDSLRIANLEASVKKLELQVSLLQKENTDLKEKMDKKDNEIGILKRQLTGKYAQIQQTSTNLRRAETQIYSLTSQVKRHQIEEKRREDRQKTQRKLSQTPKQNQKCKDLQSQLHLMSEQIDKNSRIFQNRENALYDMVYENCQKISRLSSVQVSDNKEEFINNFAKFTENLSSYLSVTKFLADSEIVAQPQNKMWLMNQVTQLLPWLQVTRTRRLYRYDHLNKTNFHNYFDQRPNILILVKLANGFIVGGFTRFSFDPKKIENPGKGFLFNLNSRLVFHQKSEPLFSVTQYDSYYISLGNAQLRIKSGQLLLFSNFGIGNSVFDARQKKRIDFMGCEGSEIDIEDYEVHQILE